MKEVSRHVGRTQYLWDKGRNKMMTISSFRNNDDTLITRRSQLELSDYVGCTVEDYLRFAFKHDDSQFSTVKPQFTLATDVRFRDRYDCYTFESKTYICSVFPTKLIT